MKNYWLRFGFGLLMSLAGCSSEFQDPTLSKTVPISKTIPVVQKVEARKTLEEQLFEDAADGRIDMPLERATLIAGGCLDSMVDYYSDELKKLTSEVLESVKQKKTRGDLEKATEIAREIKKRTEYKIMEYRFEYTLNPGIRRGNCLLLSLLFDRVCEKAKIKSGFMSHMSHAFNFVEADGKRYYRDVTTTDLNPEKVDLKDSELHECSPEEAISNIYCLKGVRLERVTEDAEGAWIKGLKVYPRNMDILENLFKMYQFIDIDKSLKYIGLYIAAYPKVPSLYAHRAKIFMHLKRYDEALVDLNKAVSLDSSEVIVKFRKDMLEQLMEESKRTGKTIGEIEKKE